MKTKDFYLDSYRKKWEEYTTNKIIILKSTLIEVWKVKIEAKIKEKNLNISKIILPLILMQVVYQ